MCVVPGDRAMPTLTPPRPGVPFKMKNSVLQKKVWTDEELLALPENGKHELVNGELVHMSPARPQHGKQIFSFSLRLGNFVNRRKLGECYDGQTSFWMKSGNLRSPDISFIPHARVKLLESAGDTFFHGAPDLAVEVLSPSERSKDIAEKLVDYFESGARLVWLIDSATKTVRVHRDAINFKLLQIGDTLSEPVKHLIY